MKLINKDDALSILDAEIKDNKDFLEKIPSYHSERSKEYWKNMITGIELAYSYINSIEPKDVDLENSMVCNVDWYDGFILDYTQEQQDEILKKIGADVGDKIRVILIKE